MPLVENRTNKHLSPCTRQQRSPTCQVCSMTPGPRHQVWAGLMSGQREPLFSKGSSTECFLRV